MAPRRAELLVGLAGAVSCAAGMVIWAPSGAGIAAAAVMGAALGTARRYPRASWIVAAAALLAAAPQGTLPLPTFFAPGAIAFCAARWDGRWGGIAAFVALFVAAEIGVAADPGSDESPVPPLLLLAAAWGAGRALRARELVAAELAERARELEEEREAHAALSVRYERARIASELHDIVAHAISVMVVQASAGQRLAATDPGLTAETFDTIAAAARQAESDMGHLVALLGDDGATAAAPDLALVEELVARAAGSGLAVTLRLEGEREGLPPALAQAAYRVVQEALTNALRYASGAAVAVLVRGERDALVVEVENEPSSGEVSLVGVGTGNGLRGLRERVDALGGTLAAGPSPEGAWRVRARMPRRMPAAAGLTHAGESGR